MATVNKEIAKSYVENNGIYEDEPEIYCVVMYQNRTKYGEEGEIGYDPENSDSCWDFAIYFDRRGYLNMFESPVVGGVEVLWGNEQFYEDEIGEMDWEDVFTMLENERCLAECDNGGESDPVWFDGAKTTVRGKMIQVAEGNGFEV